MNFQAGNSGAYAECRLTFEPEVDPVNGQSEHHTEDEALWLAIRNRTRAISFERYANFVNRVLGGRESSTHAFQLIKSATQAFLLTECGVAPEGRGQDKLRSSSLGSGSRHSEHLVRKKLEEYLGPLPQLEHVAHLIIEDLPEPNEDSHAFDRILMSPAKAPCLLELIWSYWLEEGMLVQTMNEVTRRFRNTGEPADWEPLSQLNTDPLRPLDNILWAYIQDEPHRLSVKRRAYEYTHQYGLSLSGKAIIQEGQIGDHSNVIEVFHKLLRLAMKLFKEDDNTTVIADGYPLLRTLTEVHLMMAEGAHNQFGDLPWTARAEMLQQQWMLARTEVRDFLNSRETVSGEEAWMPQVDGMKTLQGWSGVSITHFHDLSVYGEQIMLSVRYGSWTITNDPDTARNWARYWRPEIQGYLYASRNVNGIDLTA